MKAEIVKPSETESVLTIEIRIKHEAGDRDAIERHVDNLLDSGYVQALITDPLFIDGDCETTSASCTIEPYTSDEIEPCDECSGMLHPEAQHDDHCSRNLKNSV